MEKKKILTRVHGGAVLNAEMKPFRSLELRNEENVFAKRELAKKACEFIEEDDYIAIDEGSTAIILAEEIVNRFKSLTVVTYSLDVFEILRKSIKRNLFWRYFMKRRILSLVLVTVCAFSCFWLTACGKDKKSQVYFLNFKP